jgi:tetratricopeptide (TPR) repeat protein
MNKIKILIIFPVVATLTCLFSNSYIFAQADEQKFQLAQSYEKSGDINSAIRIYEELYQANKSEINKSEKYFEPIVRIYKSQNRFEELQLFVNERVKLIDDKKLKSSSDLLILSGEINWRLGNTDAANSDWEKAKANFGNEIQTFFDLVATFNSLRLFDKSIPILLEAKKIFSDKNPENIQENITITDGLIRIYAVLGNFKDGFDETLNYLKLTENLQQVQGKLFGFMNSDSAINYIENQFPRELNKNDNYLLISLYGWFLRTTKNFEKAFEVFQKIDKQTNSKGLEVYRFADESRRDGQFDIALKAFQYVIDMGKESKQSNSALFNYSKTMEERFNSKTNFTQKEAEEIIKSYKNIVKKFPKTEHSEQSKIRIAYLENKILKNNKNAINELKSVIETNFRANLVVEAMNDLTEIYLQEGNINLANETINSLQKSYNNSKNNPKSNQKNNPIANELNKSKFLQAEIFYFSGKIDSALAIYNSLSQMIDNDIANDALNRTVFIEQNKDFVQALNFYSKADFFTFQGKNDSAIKFFNEAAQISKGEQIGENSLIKVAELEIENKNFVQSRKILSDYLNENIYPIFGDNALFLLGNISEFENKNPEAVDFYSDILLKYPRSVLINEARKRIRILRNES